MNNRLIHTIIFVSASTLFLTSCGDVNDSFVTNNNGTPTNNNLISQNNFTIRSNPVDPKFFDPAEGNFTSVTAEISVQIGDNNNQLITGSRVINFRTEWGLIDPSCTTENGTCSVTWRSSSPDTMPANFLNTIIAYSNDGQESYADINGNGIFDDGDAFNTSIYVDIEEPFINSDESFSGGLPSFTTADIIIDTINGGDLTGSNTAHDGADGFFNGPNCAHSTLCSPVRSTVTVWESFAQLLNGGETYSIGGTVSGLTSGTLTLQINSGGENANLNITSNGNYDFEIFAGTSYTISVQTNPTGLTCNVSNGGTVTPTGDVTNADIVCM